MILLLFRGMQWLHASKYLAEQEQPQPGTFRPVYTLCHENHAGCDALTVLDRIVVALDKEGAEETTPTK